MNRQPTAVTTGGSGRELGSQSSIYGRGWYQAGWSQELEVGKVQPLQYFGEHLVLYRSEDGEVHIMDAHCAHFGAHLGYGGVVEGSAIKCPFHEWLWDESGKNVRVPYGEGRCTKRMMRIWPAEEKGGLIFVWYSPDRASPTWALPELPLENEPGCFAMFPGGVHRETISFPSRLILENIADLAHLKYIHKFAEIPTLVECTSQGRVFRTVFDGMTPTSRGHAKIRMTQEAHGLGLVRTETTGIVESVGLAGYTPVDGLTTVVHMSRWMKCPSPDMEGQQPSGRALRFIQNNVDESLGPHGDRPIFENMRYQERPAYTREEIGSVREIREWTKQFFLPGCS